MFEIETETAESAAEIFLDRIRDQEWDDSDARTAAVNLIVAIVADGFIDPHELAGLAREIRETLEI